MASALCYILAHIKTNTPSDITDTNNIPWSAVRRSVPSGWSAGFMSWRIASAFALARSFTSDRGFEKGSRDPIADSSISAVLWINTIELNPYLSLSYILPSPSLKMQVSTVGQTKLTLWCTWCRSYPAWLVFAKIYCQGWWVAPGASSWRCFLWTFRYRDPKNQCYVWCFFKNAMDNNTCTFLIYWSQGGSSFGRQRAILIGKQRSELYASACSEGCGYCYKTIYL